MVVYLPMRTIVHLSDLHFGRFDHMRTEPLLRAISDISPDLVIISGDFTQRSRLREYKEAQDFIHKIKHPLLTIPGNHDIRYFFSPLARVFEPFGRYKRFVNPVLEPVYMDNEVAIAGLNTATFANLIDGRVKASQVRKLKKWFAGVPKDVIRVVVTHHPLDMPPDWPDHKLARRAELAIKELGEAGVDLYLSGHYHGSYVSRTADRYKIEGYSAITVQAGTLSERTRSQLQTFNVIRVDHHHITVETHLWNITKGCFEPFETHEFKFSKGQWIED